MDKMKEEELPSKREVIGILNDEMDFIRYQRAKIESKKYEGEVDESKLRIFDEIETIKEEEIEVKRERRISVSEET